MGDKHQGNWLSALPWVLLARRTAFQPELNTSPAEIVYGETITIPGDLPGSDLQSDSDLPSLLERLRTKAARPPVQTSHHSTPSVYMPENMHTATHNYLLKGKPTPLGERWDGPFEIIERLGDHCLKVQVASYASGAPRFETVNWNNCKVPYFVDEPITVEKPKRGRKPNSGLE